MAFIIVVFLFPANLNPGVQSMNYAVVVLGLFLYLEVAIVANVK